MPIPHASGTAKVDFHGAMVDVSGEAERLPALPAAAAMPVQTLPLYRPPSAEALELLSATNSGAYCSVL